MFVSTRPVLCVQKCLSFRSSEGAKATAEGVWQEDPVESWGGRFRRLEDSSQALLWLRAGYLRCRCDGCEAVLLGIEQQVLRANQYKENHSRTQQQVEAEVRKGALISAPEYPCFVSLSYESWCRCNKQSPTGRHQTRCWGRGECHPGPPVGALCVLSDSWLAEGEQAWRAENVVIPWYMSPSQLKSKRNKFGGAP